MAKKLFSGEEIQLSLSKALKQAFINKNHSIIALLLNATIAVGGVIVSGSTDSETEYATKADFEAFISCAKNNKGILAIMYAYYKAHESTIGKIEFAAQTYMSRAAQVATATPVSRLRAKPQQDESRTTYHIVNHTGNELAIVVGILEGELSSYVSSSLIKVLIPSANLKKEYRQLLGLDRRKITVKPEQYQDAKNQIMQQIPYATIEDQASPSEMLVTFSATELNKLTNIINSLSLSKPVPKPS